MRSQQREFDSRERGQSLVEMTLGFVVLLVILMGLVDLGRAYLIYIALEESAGEGAVYLSINPDCLKPEDGPQCQDPHNAEYRARNVGGREVDWSKVKLTFTRTTPYGVGDPVSVKVEYSFSLLTPLISRIVGDNGLTVSTTATHIIISTKEVAGVP
jgi:hypothetical protein